MALITADTGCLRILDACALKSTIFDGGGFILGFNMLERLVYRSKSTSDIGSLALFDLLTKARKKNELLNISGHLIFDGEFFTQWIEGPSKALESLWHSLLKDDRHHQIMLVSRAPIEKRRFSEWSMAFSSYPSLNSHNMPGFFPVNDGNITERINTLIS